MKIGVTYPQTSIEADPGAVRAWTQAAEQMGFAHVLVYDHVLGAGRATRPNWNKPYDLDSAFHDPFVLFSFMAAQTRTIAFATGVLILTQRQAALVAKQAACVDILSEGRLRLGVGTGWNDIEYEALDMDFASRGARVEEQVEVMRRLWTERAVTFGGAYHTISDAGIFPMPVQRPIPVWFGGGSDRALFGEKANEKVIRRIARLGDGWIQLPMPQPRAKELIDLMHGFAREYGRDPAQIGVEQRLELRLKTQDTWVDQADGWRDMGLTHLSVTTDPDGVCGVDAHIKRLELFRQAVPAGS
jgi:probable F420-dependent oxidoreductase